MSFSLSMVHIQSLELKSVKTGGHPDRTPLNMIWDSWSRFFGLRIDLTWTRNGPGLELDNIFESFKRSQMKLRQIWEFLLLRALVTAVTSTPSEKKIIFKAQRNKTFYHWGHTHILVFILFNELVNTEDRQTHFLIPELLLRSKKNHLTKCLNKIMSRVQNQS